MEASELRIGNIVILGRTRLRVINVWDIENLHLYADKGYKPIPLTSELLDKAFKAFRRSHGGILADLVEDGVVKHFHQLQNLFYSLYGEELELKP